jgi:hypothetical protein
MVSNLHIQCKDLGYIFFPQISSEKNHETNELLDRCGLGPLFSSQLLPHSHTAPNQSRTTNNIVVYLYKKIHYNVNLTKPTKRKEIRTNLYLFQFHIALKIDLGESGKRDWLFGIGFVMPYFAAVCGEELFGLSESTISVQHQNKRI